MKDRGGIVSFMRDMMSYLLKLVQGIAGYGRTSICKLMRFCKIPEKLIAVVLMMFDLPVSVILSVLDLMTELVCGLMQIFYYMLVVAPLFLVKNLFFLPIINLTFWVIDSIKLTLFSIYYLVFRYQWKIGYKGMMNLFFLVGLSATIVYLFVNLAPSLLILSKVLAMLTICLGVMDVGLTMKSLKLSENGKVVALKFMGYSAGTILLICIGLCMLFSGAGFIGAPLLDLYPLCYICFVTNFLKRLNGEGKNFSNFMKLSLALTTGSAVIRLIGLLVSLYVPITGLAQVGLHIIDKVVIGGMMVSVFTLPIVNLYTDPGKFKGSLPVIPSFRKFGKNNPKKPSGVPKKLTYHGQQLNRDEKMVNVFTAPLDQIQRVLGVTYSW